MSRPRCGFTGKEIYETSDEARAALGAHRRRGGSVRRITDRCVFCSGFHLTKGMRGKPRGGK